MRSKRIFFPGLGDLGRRSAAGFSFVMDDTTLHVTSSTAASIQNTDIPPNTHEISLVKGGIRNAKENALQMR